jgi:hypothetical protein
MVFPSWLYLVVYLIIVCIACNFTRLRFDAYVRMLQSTPSRMWGFHPLPAVGVVTDSFMGVLMYFKLASIQFCFESVPLLTYSSMQYWEI